MANYLITGYWGEPHVTAENDRGINAGMLGAGRFVLPVGEQFNAEYIGNNTVRMYDGKLIDNGAAAGIPAGEYVDLLIAEAAQGMKRNDLIVFQYSQDASTLIETGTFVVIKGTETSGTPTDPTLTHEDLLSGGATFDQMALWRVSVSSTVISAPVKLFEVSKTIPDVGDSAAESAIEEANAYTDERIEDHTHSASDITSGTLPVSRGGTGVTSNPSMLVNLESNTAATILKSSPRPGVIGILSIENGGTGADNEEDALSYLGAAPAYDYGEDDLTAGESELETGKLYFVYE